MLFSLLVYLLVAHFKLDLKLKIWKKDSTVAKISFPLHQVFLNLGATLLSFQYSGKFHHKKWNISSSVSFFF